MSICQFRRRAFGFFALGWFVVTLTPHLHVLRDEPFVADRYAYLPSYGAALFVVLAVAALCRRLPRMAEGSVFGLIVLAFAGLTIAQNSTWRTERDLWENAVAVSPTAWRTHQNLGFVYLNEGRIQQAMTHFTEVDRLSPGARLVHLVQGRQAVEKGDFEAAIPHLKQVLDVRQSLEASILIADAYAGTGNHDSAIAHYLMAQRSGERDPGNLKGHAASRLGQLQDAVAGRLDALRRRATANPESSGPIDLAMALDRYGHYPEALATYAAIEQARGPHWALYLNMAISYAKHGQTVQAIDYEKSIQLNACYPNALNSIGLLYGKVGQPDKARRAFEAAINCDPDFHQAPFIWRRCTSGAANANVPWTDSRTSRNGFRS